MNEPSGSLYTKSVGPLSCYKEYLIAFVSTDLTLYETWATPTTIYAIVVSWCNWYLWADLWLSIFAILCVFGAKYSDEENEFWNGLKSNMLWRLTVPFTGVVVVFAILGMQRW